MAAVTAGKNGFGAGGTRPVVNGFRLRDMAGALIFGLIAGFCGSLGLVASVTCRAFCGGG